MNTQRSLIEQARAGLDRTGERLMKVVQPLSNLAFEPCRLPMPVPVPVRRPRPLGALIASALVATMSFGPAPARAAYVDQTRDAMSGDLVQVRVLVEGESAPLFLRPGDWSKGYFQAFKGRHYALEIRNRTDRRIGVAISVDGLNVVNGERTRLGSNEAMYVLDPFERAVIQGWRTSLEQVRRFVFVDEQRSYASRTGQANGDMGWIRVNAFREWQPVVRWERDFRGPLQGPSSGAPAPLDEPARRQAGESKAGAQSNAPAPSAKLDASEQRLIAPVPQAEAFPGTGWGDKRRDVVQRVDFHAVSVPTDQLVFRYEYESGLRALGIELRRRRLQDREHGELGFAKPPRW
jgi:hypothetical protein